MKKRRRRVNKGEERRKKRDKGESGRGETKEKGEMSTSYFLFRKT